MSAEKPAWIEAVKVHSLSADDIIIFKTAQLLTKVHRENILGELKHHFPNRKVFLLSEGFDLEVLRGDGAPKQ